MAQWADDRTVLVGRSTERAALRAALDDARRGRGRAVVLRGPPGIGKTALLEDAVRDAEAFRVLRTRSTESEAGLAFAGLSDLSRPCWSAFRRSRRPSAPPSAPLWRWDRPLRRTASPPTPPP